MNLDKSVKSRGILAFAFNTKETDYISIAHKTLSLAGQILGLPYTLITDEQILSMSDNNRYNPDIEQFVEWKNPGRYMAYELSPYNETLVIDVDYLVQDSSLLKIFDLDWDYILQRHSTALTHEIFSEMGHNSLPYIWATVFAFRKTPRAKLFFDLVKRVQEHYGYYRSLFNIRERNYRNDYAFAIADIVLNGYTIATQTIPGSMLTVDQKITSIQYQTNRFIIKDTQRAYVVPRTNLHILSKQYLASDDFGQLIDNIKNESA
jgi:hypothetical protein